MSFGNSDSFVHFFVTVEISWWRYQFKSPPIARLFLEIIISSCISLNVVFAVFSQLSFQFHVNLWEWHSLPVSRCNLACGLFFKIFCLLFVDWYTFQFQCCPSWLLQRYCYCHLWKWMFSFVYLLHFIVFILLGKFSSS